MSSQNSTSTNPPVAGAYTRAEILSQPGSWQSAIDAVISRQTDLKTLFAQHRDRPVVFVGCGSPYYLDMSAAATYRTLTGKWAIAVPASEILFNLSNVIPGALAPLVVAVSRSGETSELMAACRMLKAERSCPVVAITVSENTTLSQIADVTVYIPHAAERSVAQTRSFAAMLVATLATVALAAGRTDLLGELQAAAGQGDAYLQRIEPPIAQIIGRGFDRMFFLGSGLRNGLAHEGSLKMKEMSLSNSEPFHFMEFRHGPQSMIDEHTLVVGLVSQHARTAEIQVLHEMVSLGGTVVAIQPPSDDPATAPFTKITLPAGFSEVAGLVFYMPVLHLLAYHQAMRKGLNCDSPRNLHAWIKLPDVSPLSGQ
ncbi:MAG: SIS domain-containing protein [Chloroflexi bacterium]|nr:SIS domain-containing protein [Chloroflexota bacterium]MCL5275195.1 SIS domain-containing protein [Chloroflexota bacterium]